MAKWGETEWNGTTFDEDGYYTEVSIKHDPVKKPAHYNQNGTMECIEAIEALAVIFSSSLLVVDKRTKSLIFGTTEGYVYIIGILFF